MVAVTPPAPKTLIPPLAVDPACRSIMVAPPPSIRMEAEPPPMTPPDRLVIVTVLLLAFCTP